MEKKEFTHMNEVILSGPVVRKFSNDLACNITLRLPRNPLPGYVKEGTPLYDYPGVAFYGQAGKEAADSFKEGDDVEIRCMIQPQRRTVKETGREYFEERLVGQEIKPAEKLLMKEFGYDEGPAADTKNEVRLGGIVSRVSVPSRGIVSISIRTFVNGRVNNVQTFLYEQNTQKYLDDFRPGDQVFAVGSVQTVRKENTGKENRFFRNIVLRAICKAE